MVEKGRYLDGEHLALDCEDSEEIVNHQGNGRIYYEYLREQKNRQKGLVNGDDLMSMPLDTSDYNTMFMTF